MQIRTQINKLGVDRMQKNATANNRKAALVVNRSCDRYNGWDDGALLKAGQRKQTITVMLLMAGGLCNDDGGSWLERAAVLTDITQSSVTHALTLG